MAGIACPKCGVKVPDRNRKTLNLRIFAPPLWRPAAIGLYHLVRDSK